MSPRKKKLSVEKVQSVESSPIRSVTTRSASMRNKRPSPLRSLNISPAKEQKAGSSHTAKSPSKVFKAACDVPKTPKKGLVESKSPIRTISTRKSPIKTPQILSFQKEKNISSLKKLDTVRMLPLCKLDSSSPSPCKVASKKSSPSPKASPSKQKELHNDGSPIQVKAECLSDDERGKISKAIQAPPIAPSEQPFTAHQVKKEVLDQYHSELKGRQPDPPLPLDPEQSGRFLRRKWFSLKSRGGFTCLRSAILTPEEIAKEVIQRTTGYIPQKDQANFFTTKLMVRLASRLPPTRARPSCEELVELINSKQKQTLHSPQPQPPKGESTAIRVKVEKRSFSDTVSQVTNPPLKLGSEIEVTCVGPSSYSPQTIKDPKLEEREIALRQLKNMSYWRGGQYRY